MNTNAFERQLRMENYAANSIVAYRYAVQDYYAHYSALNKDNLLKYKGALVERYRPKSVNLRIRGINKYLEFIGRNDLKIKTVKLSKSSFLEHVISNEDYVFFKKRLRREKDLQWYFIVWTLAATGARISELVQLKAEHVRTGYYDIANDLPFDRTDGDKLYRDVTIHVLPIQKFVTSVSADGSAIGSTVTVTLTLKEGLSSSVFPLQIAFEDSYKRLNPKGTDMPARVGKSMVTGHTERSYQFVKSISYAEYSENHAIIDCVFKRTAQGETTLYMENEYFTSKNITIPATAD